ncbi:MAG TPA: 5-oxoprolinase subunit PxpB [Candidatus Baltobacteraceae bacterium]|nr:5-oxoprolinase subunit PxpB [Candidatus Baltobacteraceae bacterium]
MRDFGTPNFERVGQSTIILDCTERNALVRQRLWSLAREIRAWPHVLEAVIGDGNLSLVFDRHAVAYDALRSALETAWSRGGGERIAGRTIEIAVSYGGECGPDLAAVAQACGLREDDVIALHARGEYVVAFVGFLPGFAYLDGLDPRLQLPRRAQPRTRVPAGSVAIAGAQSGIYPVDSPGGWHLIGHTAHVLFDPMREPPALLEPGDRVRFVPA